MTDAALIEALRWMLISRIYDERATALQRQGLYGVFSPAAGQEASVVGSAMALDPARDWIVPQYRELIALVRHGYPLERSRCHRNGADHAGHADSRWRERTSDPGRARCAASTRGRSRLGAEAPKEGLGCDDLRW